MNNNNVNNNNSLLIIFITVTICYIIIIFIIITSKEQIYVMLIYEKYKENYSLIKRGRHYSQISIFDILLIE